MLERQEALEAVAEASYGVGRARSAMLSQIVQRTDGHAVHHHHVSLHGTGREPQIIDEIVQAILPHCAVVVAFRRAGLVGDRSGAELAGVQLSPEAIGRFQQGDLDSGEPLPLEKFGREEAAGSTSDDSDTCHHRARSHRDSLTLSTDSATIVGKVGHPLRSASLRRGGGVPVAACVGGGGAETDARAVALVFQPQAGPIGPRTPLRGYPF